MRFRHVCLDGVITSDNEDDKLLLTFTQNGERALTLELKIADVGALRNFLSGWMANYRHNRPGKETI